MNIYRAVITGTPKHGEPYEREMELAGETEGDARRRAKIQLPKHEKIKSVEYDRPYDGSPE